MGLNSGGMKSSRTVGRTYPRFGVTTGQGRSTSTIRRVGQKLTNAIFGHPADKNPAFEVTLVGPEIVSLLPVSGTNAGGTAVAIRGDKFTGATGVTIGGVAATAFVVVDDEHITCTSGAHANGAVNVVVLHPNGNATKTNGYTYT